MSIRAVRYVVFLKDTLTLSLTSFGGPQVLLAMILERMVKKRGGGILCVERTRKYNLLPGEGDHPVGDREVSRALRGQLAVDIKVACGSKA